MTSNTIYVFEILSSRCTEDPKVEFQGMDMLIRLKGRGWDRNLAELQLCFKGVLCQKNTALCFKPMLYGSTDAVVELFDSEWLNSLKAASKESYDFWKPRHFLVMLEDVGGLWEIIAQSVEIDFHKCSE